MTKPEINLEQVLIVTGATGVGKTELILKLAQQIPSEIINADIGQMYQPLTVGTAKPDWKNELTPHHGFDIIIKPENFTVVQYRAFVLQKIVEIQARGKMAMIVGGSTFYIKALLFPPQEHIVVKQDCELELEEVQDHDLWDQLNLIDPVRAQKIDLHDVYRLRQALNIWHKTGEIPSRFVPKYDPIAPYQLVILDRPKVDLYARCNGRVHDMMQSGWIKEVNDLTPEWKNFLQIKKIIGYEVILDYLAGRIDLPACISLIQKRVRNYAKRQQTFWRGLKIAIANQNQAARVLELDLTLCALDLYINQLRNKLNK